MPRITLSRKPKLDPARLDPGYTAEVVGKVPSLGQCASCKEYTKGACASCLAPQRICRKCGNTFNLPNRAKRSEVQKYMICHDCILTATRINSYDFKVRRPNYHKLSSEDTIRYYGIEFEAEWTLGRPNDDDGHDQARVQNAIRDVWHTLPYNIAELIFFKHDGSLRTGVEVVTAPATIQYLISLPWDAFFAAMKHAKFASFSTGTCGLHIHATLNSKKFASKPMDFYNRIAFVVYIIKDLLLLISRRGERPHGSPERYAEYRSIYPVRDATHKYGAVRVCMHPAGNTTVEFRFPRGTLSTRTFYATLQCVTSILTFAEYLDLPENLQDYAESLNDAFTLQLLGLFIEHLFQQQQYILIEYIRARATRRIRGDQVKQGVLMDVLKSIKRMKEAYVRDSSSEQQEIHSVAGDPEPVCKVEPARDGSDVCTG